MNLVAPIRNAVPRHVLNAVVAPFHHLIALWTRPSHRVFTYQGNRTFQTSGWGGATDRKVGQVEGVLGFMPVFGYFSLGYIGAEFDIFVLQMASLALVLVALAACDVTVELVGGPA